MYFLLWSLQSKPEVKPFSLNNEDDLDLDIDIQNLVLDEAAETVGYISLQIIWDNECNFHKMLRNTHMKYAVISAGLLVYKSIEKLRCIYQSWV